MLASSVIEAIGKTPFVSLSRMTKGLEGRILAKLEYLKKFRFQQRSGCAADDS